MAQDGKSGFRSIGNLTETIVNSPQNAATTFNGSASSGKRSLTGTPAKQIAPPTGTPNSAAGAVALTVSSPEWLKVIGKAQHDARALLSPAVVSRLDLPKMTLGDNWDGYCFSYELLGPIAEADRDEALRTLRQALRPVTKVLVTAELTRLRLKVRTADREEIDLDAQLAVYVDDIVARGYPEDAVKEAVREWPGSFWPDFAELKSKMERLTTPRRALVDALMRGYRPAANSPDWIPPSPADKEAVTAKLAAIGWRRDAEGHYRPIEEPLATPQMMRQVSKETKGFKLPDENDPAVQTRLKEMGGATPGAIDPITGEKAA